LWLPMPTLLTGTCSPTWKSGMLMSSISPLAWIRVKPGSMTLRPLRVNSSPLMSSLTLVRRNLQSPLTVARKWRVTMS